MKLTDSAEMALFNLRTAAEMAWVYTMDQSCTNESGRFVIAQEKVLGMAGLIQKLVSDLEDELMAMEELETESPRCRGANGDKS